MILICISGVAAAPAPCDVQESDSILIIHSYGPDMDWVGAVKEGIFRVFPEDDPGTTYYAEYMDGKIISDQKHYENLAEVYRHKYAAIPFDLIIVSDDDAYTFIRAYGEELFPGVPVVFFGVSDYRSVHHEEMPDMTGIVERTRVGPTLDLISTLQPGVREIYVVNNPGTTTGKIFAEELSRKAGMDSNTLTFRAPGEMRITELRKDLRNLTPDTAVLLMDFNRDRDGRIYSDSEIAGIVSDSSPVPVYGISDTFIGHGVVGGVVPGTADQAEYAARMGADILNGTSVRDIPVSVSPEGQVVVDYSVMQRYGLLFSLLPEHSVVINKPTSGIVLPGWMVAAIMVGACSLTLVVGVLIRSNRRIAKAREDLDVSNRKLKTLFSITRHDVNNQVMVASGFLELVSEDVIDSDVQPFFSNIRKALHNIEHQIAFAREYEMAGASEPGWQNLQEVVEQAVSPQDAVSVDVALLKTEIYADPMLEKVFANLFDNTVRHGEHATQVWVRVDTRGDERVVVVEDNGVGVPDEKKAHIFERGYGANTGYGLFLASDILAITGLSIAETGTYGTGARFEITVPKGRWRPGR